MKNNHPQDPEQDLQSDNGPDHIGLGGACIALLCFALITAGIALDECRRFFRWPAKDKHEN